LGSPEAALNQIENLVRRQANPRQFLASLETTLGRVTNPDDILSSLYTLLRGRRDAQAFLKALNQVPNPRRIVDSLTRDVLDTPLSGGFDELFDAVRRRPSDGTVERLISVVDSRTGELQMFREIRRDGDVFFQRWNGDTKRWVRGRSVRSYTDFELEGIVKTTPDIVDIRGIASQMDSGTRGSLFERWANRYVFGKKNKLRVNVDENAHLQILDDFPEGMEAAVYREMDHYDEIAEAIWDAKMYSTSSRPDPGQHHDYLLMLEAGEIKAAGRPQPVKVKSVNYLFSDIHGAKASAGDLIPATVWYLDDAGKPVKLR
jgi:hypothetical protein